MMRLWAFIVIALGAAVNVGLYAHFHSPINAAAAAFVLVIALSLVGLD